MICSTKTSACACRAKNQILPSVYKRRRPVCESKHELHERQPSFVFRAYFLVNYILSFSLHSCRESAGGPADAPHGISHQVDDLLKLQTHESAVGAQGLEMSITVRYGQQQMPRWLVDGPDDTERRGPLANEVYLRLSTKSEARSKKSLKKSKAKVSGDADDDEAENAAPALARALLDISLADQTDVARRKAVTPTNGELIEFEPTWNHHYQKSP